MMGFWIFMMIMCLLTPALMIGFGRYFVKGGPKKINGVFGYRTARSMKNQETWIFAHQYSGKIWLRSGLVMLPTSLAAMFFLFGKSIDLIGSAGAVIIILQCVVMISAIPETEAALRRNFDDSGKHR